ncbi:MAG: hypothetical protein QGG40_01425 [Myxococcota bacterium]|nr:hypothetical protein [Myxococcota bacterium]
MILLVALWTMTACTESELDLSACGAAECRVDRVVDAWRHDSEATSQVIASLESPEEQLALVIRLVKEVPGESTTLCVRLEESVRSRCDQMHARPHLWLELPEAPSTSESSVERTGDGPAHTRLEPTREVVSSFHHVRKLGTRCKNARDPQSCVVNAAVKATQERDGERAARICRSVTDSRMQEECMFRAAEGRVRTEMRDPKKGLGYRQATNLCLMAGSFLQNCLAHTVVIQAEWAPDAQDSRSDAWDSVIRSVQWVRTVWEERDPDLGELLVDRMWSDAASFAYTGTTRVTGWPLESLPVEAHPHVRAAAAARLVELEGDSEGAPEDLGGWERRLAEALDDRTAKDRRRQPSERFKSVVDFWPEDLSGEEQRPARFYMGTARRTWSEEAAVDRSICILEAVARQEAVPSKVLEEGLEHSVEEVRWTAGRLMEKRIPSDVKEREQP